MKAKTTENNVKGSEFEVLTSNEGETYRLGEILGDFLIPGDIVCLDGDLGAGKTVFAKGLAKSIGVGGIVTSPTFTILSEFDDGRIPFFHFDAYRVGCEEEFSNNGFEDYFYSRGVCVIEWAGKIGNIIPDNAIRIFIMRNKGSDSDKRNVIFVFPKNDERAKIIKERIEKG